MRVQTSAVVGDLDPLKKGVEELKDVLPGLSVVVLKGADHITAFGRTDFAQAVGAFIAKNSLQRVPAQR